ncbi:DMT family transporter [Aliagarivorans taiwanensis]|uniref:DMT family transporter n=1 Tax=Aliagarivorans taiwanensis TaxID=561966 RepID=UPI00041A86BB|nr:DMT family transporter [Aliagarivorans taiwanensis]
MNTSTYIKLSLSAFFWGGSAIAGKIAMQTFSVSLVTMLRFSIAALALLVLYRRQIKAYAMPAKQHLRVAFTAFFGITACYYFYFGGLKLSSAFNAGIIEATIPCLTLFIATCSGKRERLTKVIGFLAAYIGVIYIVFEGKLENLLTIEYSVGDLLLLFSTFCFAIYNILVERNKRDTPNTLFMFYIFFYGSLLLLPWPVIDWMVAGNSMLLQPIEFDAIIAVLFMAMGGSVIAYLFFNQAISVVGAASASSFINLVPVITVFLSVAYLGEDISVSQWTGSLIIFIGVAVSNYEPKRERSSPTPMVSEQVE